MTKVFYNRYYNLALVVNEAKATYKVVKLKDNELVGANFYYKSTYNRIVEKYKEVKQLNYARC